MCERMAPPAPQVSATEAERLTKEMFLLLLKSQALLARLRNAALLSSIDREEIIHTHDALGALNRDLGIGR